MREPHAPREPALRATLAESRALRLVTFAALYFAQGVPWGFVTVAYVVFLTDHGIGKSDVGGAIAIAYLPWAFKVFAGPIIDRFPTRRFGRRRHFIIGAELAMGATLLLLPFFDPKAGLGPIHALLFVHNAFAAIQDASTDALAVDVLPAQERGKANSIMWAAKVGGSATGGSLGVLLAKTLGWTTLFVACAVIVWAVMLLVVFVRERPDDEAAVAAEKRLELRAVWRSFAFKTPIVGAVIALTAPMGYALVSTVYTTTLRSDLGLGDDAIATLTFVDTPTGVVGALAGGFVADRIGPRRAMAIGMVGIGACLATFAAARPLWTSMAFLLVYTIVSSLFQYAYNSASLGFFMTISNPAIGATQFSLYMAAANVTYSWTAKTGGWMGEHWGVARVFAIAAVVQVAAVALLPFCDPREAEARFR